MRHTRFQLVTKLTTLDDPGDFKTRVFRTGAHLAILVRLWSAIFTARCTVCLSVCPSVTLLDCDHHICWKSSEIISPLGLVRLGCTLSADPNIRGLLLQGGHPEILAQSDPPPCWFLSLGEIRSRIAAEWLQVVQRSQWRAYRKPPSLFRMVLSLTPLRPPLSPSGCESLRWGVSHTGSLSPFSSILGILHVELQVLHVVLDDVDPSLSLSSSAPLSTYVCLQDPLDTIILLSPLYMPIPSQPGLPYLIRDTRYSKDATLRPSLPPKWGGSICPQDTRMAISPQLVIRYASCLVVG